jgi:hypothetical protein
MEYPLLLSLPTRPPLSACPFIPFWIYGGHAQDPFHGELVIIVPLLFTIPHVLRAPCGAAAPWATMGGNLRNSRRPMRRQVHLRPWARAAAERRHHSGWSRALLVTVLPRPCPGLAVSGRSYSGWTDRLGSAPPACHRVTVLVLLLIPSPRQSPSTQGLA